jgi:hypothetical protein
MGRDDKPYLSGQPAMGSPDAYEQQRPARGLRRGETIPTARYLADGGAATVMP